MKEIAEYWSVTPLPKLSILIMLESSENIITLGIISQNNHFSLVCIVLT